MSVRKKYLYLSLLPESLVASMMDPFSFGNYLAVGTKKRLHRQAMFFEIENLENTSFNMEDIERRCVPHADGQPKHSVYSSIYRVLENLPLDSIKNLYIVTRDGRVLEVERSTHIPDFSEKYHLYQEICPVHPRIVSTLNPQEFTQFITDKNRNLYIPKICFVDLSLGGLAENPESGNTSNLPYSSIEYLRECLIELRDLPDKHTKTYDRIPPEMFHFRVIKNGFFLGSPEKIICYPFPSKAILETEHHAWWRSASM